ncbi:MAG: DNA repair protein RecN [Candidatus Marinimicrobia bacterium]|jgi:DNA repair protein RecN (Recombination protein N)|nr:DNA repair protein RecN [Candidatus Neomarinimicrobiota bacterium]MDP6611931.1 DNA repair protein RecN [Candidatus Neomarinimicrobiota bacterium]|tara:strand:- start:49990 stop:51645 length:1656 start_codon:yes stop_codon:yes gene_type:complete
MIKRIYIKDFAIISELSLPLKNGLTVITGETGAGKTILLKSLGITLGVKADKTDVRSGQTQAVVEAELFIDGQSKIFRRLISKGGRTRSFINDEPIAEPQFREAAQPLADFHGQHEQQYIMDSATHIDFLDSFCNSEPQIEKTASVYNDLSAVISELEKAITLRENSANQKELLQFQVQEIQAIDPKIDEDIELGKEFKRLNHMDELITTIQGLNQSLTEHDHSIYQQLSSTINELGRLSKYDETLNAFIELIDQASVSIQDVSAEMIQYAESMEHDPLHLKEIEERLQAIEGLKRKYGGSVEAVRSFIRESEQELAELSGLDEKIVELESEKAYLKSRYQKQADQLSEIRNESAQKLSSKIESEMARLNMAGAKFQVQINHIQDADSFIHHNNKPVKFGPKGFDKIEFYLSANPGEIPKPLVKVASGGEVSRIMLSIKSVLKKSDPVETLIFDEIDSGISGQAAEKVGDALEKLSQDKQVVCITHLPQIASRAKHHLYIHKRIKNEQTEVEVRYLNDEEKVQAITELFSGEFVAAKGITSQQELRSQARG